MTSINDPGNFTAPQPPGPLPPFQHGSASSVNRNKSKPLSFWIALALLLLLLFSMLMNLGLFALIGAKNVGDAPDALQEKCVEGQGPAKICIIDMKGIITDEVPFMGGSGVIAVDKITKQLRQASADPDIKAIVLNINSPGGGVTASDILYNEVNQAKAQGKKIVVHMGDLCASGGYYIAAAADSIIASPTSITGSIGVIMTLFDAQELLEKKLGLKEIPIKSGPLKDIGSMARSMTVEEHAILQSLINEMYDRFVNIVATGRKGRPGFPGDTEGVKKLADGRIYSSQQALNAGLIDKTGYIGDAFDEARRLAGISEATVIRYHHQAGLMDLFNPNADSLVKINSGVQIDTKSLFPDLQPRFEYLWVIGN